MRKNDIIHNSYFLTLPELVCSLQDQDYFAHHAWSMTAIWNAKSSFNVFLGQCVQMTSFDGWKMRVKLLLYRVCHDIVGSVEDSDHAGLGLGWKIIHETALAETNVFRSLGVSKLKLKRPFRPISGISKRWSRSCWDPVTADLDTRKTWFGKFRKLPRQKQSQENCSINNILFRRLNWSIYQTFLRCQRCD